MTRHTGPFLAALLVIAGCGTSQDNNDSNSVVVINNSPSNATPNNSSTDPRCTAMLNAIAQTEGVACGPSGACDPIPCACADGSTVNSSSCANDICLGTQACERACGTLADCGSTTNPNSATNATPNNVDINSFSGPDDNGMQGDSCTCDDTSTGQDPGHYKICYGTEDGCDGVLGPLECVWDLGLKSGTCRVKCTEADAGTQGPCPSGYTCTEFPTIISTPQDPNYFYECG